MGAFLNSLTSVPRCTPTCFTLARAAPLNFGILWRPLMAHSAMGARQPARHAFSGAEPQAGKIVLQGWREGFGNRLSCCNPLINRIVMDAADAGPFRKSMGDAIKGYQPVNPAIIHLFDARSPAAIARRVWAVIVYTFNGLPNGAFAHIGEEVPKIGPSCANFNPAPTIILERPIVRVSTPLPHGQPSLVGPSARSMVEVQPFPHMGRPPRRATFSLASARNCAARAEMIFAHRFHCSASAFADAVFAPFRVGADNLQQSIQRVFHKHPVAFNGM